MKYSLIFVFLFIFSTELFAAEGVIKVLEAPLYREENLDSPIVQYVRKGDKIYLYDGALRDEDYIHMDTVFATEEVIKIPDRTNVSEFYATLDKQGQVAFIHKKYVDVLYLDKREFAQKPLKPDPTDYRLSEPLPKEYPLFTPTGFRSYLVAGMGPNSKNIYQYRERVKTEKYGYNQELSAMFSNKVAYDHRERLYFGGVVNFSNSRSNFDLESRSAEERQLKVGIGPYLSYDAFVTENYRISFYTSVTFNFINQHSVMQTDLASGRSETALFSGTSFSPRFGTYINLPALAEGLDIVGGISIQSEWPRKLINRAPVQYAGYWNQTENDQIDNALFQTALFLGIQKSY